jgi:glycosyltransferase involved in cell wall biosynthesis
MLDAQHMSAPTIVARLVTESRYYEAMVLNGDGAPTRQLVAAAVIARRRNPPHVIFADCAWGPSATQIHRIVDRAAIRLIDGPRVHYCVHSREQQRRFPEVWGVAEERVHVTPYYYTLSEEELAMPTQRDGSVFSGGQSRRDFGTLIEAAARIERPVRIGGQISPDDRKRLPRNVQAELVPHEEFISLLRRSSVVVVSLEHTSRSAGEQTYLNAMALGKPVIVTDTMGVREYVEHRDTGLIVPPADARALTATLEWALDPANDAEVEAMAQRAREVALTRFSPDAYIAKLLAVLDEVEATAPHSPRSTMPTKTPMPKRMLHKVMRTGYRILAATPLRSVLGTTLVRRLKRRSLQMPAEVVPSVIEALRHAGVTACVVGGWGVDALIGKQTRRHRDLDVVFKSDEDAERRALRALAGLDFKFVKREAVPGADPGCWLATRLVMADDAGRLLDLHPVEFPLIVASGGSERLFTPKDAFVTGIVAEQQVPCLSAQLQLALHEGYEARDYDREDVARLLSLR